MKSVVTTVATAAARETGFVPRASQVTGALFVQTAVLGWLNNPAASLRNLPHVAAALGVTIRPQGLDQRFSRAAAETLQRVLQAAVAKVISAEPVAIPVLARFSAVILQDSSTMSLPTDRATLWPGCGGSRGLQTAALKIHLRLDLLAGRLAFAARAVAARGPADRRSGLLPPAAVAGDHGPVGVFSQSALRPDHRV